MPYVTFRTTAGRHRIVGIYLTAAEAGLAAAGEADETSVLATELTGLDAYPMDAEPGWFLSALDATAKARRDPPFTDAELIQFAARAAHAYLLTLHDRMTTEAQGHTWAERGVVHDYIHALHQGCYEVGLNTEDNFEIAAMTTADKVAWFEAIPNGPTTPTDTSPSDLELFKAMKAWPGSSYAEIYVDLALFSQVTLGVTTGAGPLRAFSYSEAVGLARATDAQLADGGWIEDIT